MRLLSCGGSFGVKAVDDFAKNLFAGLVAVDFDEEAEGVVVLEDGAGFGAEFLEAGFEDAQIFVVLAIAAVV